MLAESAKPTTQADLSGAVLSRDGTPIACERRGKGHPLILVDGALCSRTMGPSLQLAKALQVSGGDVNIRERLEDVQLRRGRQQLMIAEKKAQSEKTEEALALYKTMKADAAAPQLAEMHVEIAAAIIMQLPARQSGLILSEMDAKDAAIVAGIMSSATDPNTSTDPS